MRVDLSLVAKFPNTCDHEVPTRDGRREVCGMLAVAVRLNNTGYAYPVCAHHAAGHMVPLADLLDPA
jgi:hypothetical protein